MKEFPTVVRGGHFDDEDHVNLRSAARVKSTDDWLKSYPEKIKTIWWLSDCMNVGFRIVRPLKIPLAEVMAECWDSAGQLK